ncbi:MAG: VOC family protein [Pseudomonadota bacterium]
MSDPDFTLLYVDSPAVSAAFYAKLLDKQPVEASPTFAMFALDSGVKLGLWARQAVLPKACALGGAVELAFAVADQDTVRAVHADWSARGLAIAQAPTRLDFGYAFLALDPDGHRLRVFAPHR